MVFSGKSATKPADPTLAGQLFNGWYTDAACTKAFDFATAITADTTLYAKWAPEKRLAGTEAENTAQEIVKQAFPEGTTSDYAVVARVDDYADALGAAGLAGAKKIVSLHGADKANGFLSLTQASDLGVLQGKCLQQQFHQAHMSLQCQHDCQRRSR